MANEEYPNATTSRYAGRIWADKSVFADETIEMDGKKFTNDSDFLVSASFLGSTRSVIGSEPLPVDLMVILDRSSSMANDYDANDNTTPNNRMKNAVTALNGLFQQVKEHSKDSRIALVAYSREVVTALPLGTYTWEGDLLSTSLVEPSNDVAYWDVTINCTDQDGKKAGKNFSTQSGTFTQGGLYEGMKQMSQVSDTKFRDSQGNYVTRQPVVILVTDGQPQQFQADNWWEPDGYQRGNVKGRPASALSTVLTGAYWKKQIQKNFQIAPKIYTIGADIGDPEGLYYQAVLNPGTGFKKNDAINGITIPDSPTYNDAAGYAYNAWEIYKEGLNVSLPDQGGNMRMFNHPATDDVTEADLNYVDNYYHTTTENLNDIFTEIMGEVQSDAFYATEESTGGKQSAVVYRDPIGEYMEVKDIKGVLWGGTLYDATKNNEDGTYSLTLAAGETTPKHPITGADIDISQMTVKVEQEIKNGKTTETLVVEIPNSCLPLRHDEITVENGQMTDYISSRFETMPLRVLYTVGIQNGVKIDEKEDGALDLSKIDATYKAKNITADGNIRFYSNRYERQLNPTGDDRFDDGAIGDTTVQFTPNSNNRYYFFQKNRQIYSNEECTVPVTADQVTDNSLPEGNYYLKIDYYVDDDKDHGYTGDHTGYTETVVERTADQLTGAVEAIDGNVYTKIGAARIGRLDYFSRNKEQNATETATYSFVPWMENNQMTAFLGNNGRLDMPNPYNFTISKEVAGNNAEQIDLDKEFQFTVKITDEDDTPLTGGYAYIGGSTMDGVIGPENDVLTLNDNGEGTITLKHGQQVTITGLPLGAKYTVTEEDYSNDGYTTTANGTEGREATGTTNQDTIPVAAFVNTKNTTAPDTGNLTVSKVVAGNAGETDKDFHFTVTLSDTSISDTFGDMIFIDGVADFTLKHGESKEATGLPSDITYEVTEEDYSGDGYVTTKTGDIGTVGKDATSTAAFTNTKDVTPIEPDPDDSSLTAKKEWILDDGGKATDSVTVVLLRDGKEYEKVELSDRNNWTFTWTGLSDGYTWTVAEVNVPDGFIAKVDQSGMTFTIINDDKPTDSDKPTDPDKPSDPGKPIDNVPKTGDETNLILWSALLGISGMGMIAALLVNKRKYREKHCKR